MKTFKNGKKLFAWLWLLCLVAIPVTSQAQSDTVRAGQSAVRNVLERRFDDISRLRFQSGTERALSTSERTVSGTGYCLIRGDDKSFRYSVKVRTSTGQARDVRIDFPSGLVVTGDGDGAYRDVDDWRNLVRIREPQNNSEERGPRVTIAGEAEGSNVRLTVYDQRGDRVANDTVTARNGWWSTVISLREGSYRAVAELANGREKSEVRFKVDARDGFGQDDIKINRPFRGQAIIGNVVNVDGRSEYSEVRVQLTDRFNKIIQENRARTSGGRFYSTFERVLTGQYKVRVYSSGSRERDEVAFSVDNRGMGGSGGWGGNGGQVGNNYLNITSPSSGANLRDRSVNFSGTARNTDLELIVTDSAGRTVNRTRINVPSSGRWSARVTMPRTGSYRGTFKGDNGRDLGSVRYTISDSGYGGSGGSSGGAASMSISSPSPDAKFRDRTVSFSGTARGTDLDVVITDTSGRTVQRLKIDVPSSGRWSARATMPKQGAYRATFRSNDGRTLGSVRFQIIGVDDRGRSNDGRDDDGIGKGRGNGKNNGNGKSNGNGNGNNGRGRGRD